MTPSTAPSSEVLTDFSLYSFPFCGCSPLVNSYFTIFPLRVLNKLRSHSYQGVGCTWPWTSLEDFSFRELKADIFRGASHLQTFHFICNWEVVNTEPKSLLKIHTDCLIKRYLNFYTTRYLNNLQEVETQNLEWPLMWRGCSEAPRLEFL